MFSLLLAIIYLSFISLGLPDSLLGSAWPVLYQDLGVPVSYAGIITMIISIGTILLSLNTDRILKKIGAGTLTFVSILTTAIALFGFSISDSFIMLCFWSIPYGVGAGAVDVALNNYVALNYSSKHMNWLHSFWGVGATISPFIMGFALTSGNGWSYGYEIVSLMQFALAFCIFLSLPMWKKGKKETGEVDRKDLKPIGLKQALKIDGVANLLVGFLCYCALEATAGLWATTFLVEARGVDALSASKFASFFYFGITFGRFLCGFISDKIGNRVLIKGGMVTIFLGILLVLLPFSNIVSLYGLVIIGFGCAPIYPSMIHSTPKSFGEDNSQAIIGILMASAYLGATFVPPLFGFIAKYISVGLYPVYLLIFAIVMYFMNEKVTRINLKKS